MSHISLALSITQQAEIGATCMMRACARALAASSEVDVSGATVLIPWRDAVQLARCDDSTYMKLQLDQSPTLSNSTPKPSLANVARENWKRAWRRARRSLGGTTNRVVSKRMAWRAKRQGDVAPVFARCRVWLLPVQYEFYLRS